MKEALDTPPCQRCEMTVARANPLCQRGRIHRLRRTRPNDRTADSSRSWPTVAALVTMATAALAAEECPSGINGWGASSDCRSYFWCTNGSRSSITYECIDGLKFDVTQATCVNPDSFTCMGEMTTTTTIAATTAAATTVAATTTTLVNDPEPNLVQNNDTVPAAVSEPLNAPTAYPTKLGPPKYYGDFRTTSCLSADGFATKPDWIDESHMYRSKVECCEEMFSWAPIESCLGPDFVETNYVIGSRSPTLSPTLSPTITPSLAPSLSSKPSESSSTTPSSTPSSVSSTNPSSVPSSMSSSSPTIGPTTSMAPTESYASPTPTSATMLLSPTTESSHGSGSIMTTRTMRPTSRVPSRPTSNQMSGMSSPSSSNPKDFLVELIGYANNDLDVLFPEDAVTNPPTAKPATTPTTGGFMISEIILPVVSDATISQERSTLNFGVNSALAVDGGNSDTGVGVADGLGERFDSLLKFDVGIIDRSRPLESAILRIYALGGCTSGGTFTTMASSSWSQVTVTWDTAPPADGHTIGSLGEIKASQWYELDVLSALAWNDAHSGFSSDNFMSIRVTSSASRRCKYSTMESGGGKAPYMAIKYAPTPQMNGNEYDSYSPKASGKIVPGQFILLRATDDSTIDASQTNTNAALDSSLKVAFDASSRTILDFVLRFDLTEMSSTPPRSVVLTLFSEQNCASAGRFSTTNGEADWSEADVSWSTAPSYQQGSEDGGTMIGTFGAVESGRWYGFDVTTAISRAIEARKGAVTFRVSAGDGSCQFSSIQSGRDPKLMVAF